MAEQPASSPYVIAVDAGGTHTRVGCFALDGAPLASAVGAAGAWHHHDDAARNLVTTVERALDKGGLRPDDAAALVAGVSGISSRGREDGDRPLAWAEQFYDLGDLRCPRRFVNDAVTAHRGALLGAPGVIVVAGTGSMVLAVTADGQEVENGQFEHYAGGARHLAFDAVQQILIGASAAGDESFVEQVLTAWAVEDVPGLRSAAVELQREDRHTVDRHYGGLAPLVTAAASSSPLADRCVRRLARRTADGVLLLAPMVGAELVPITVTGALATDQAFVVRLRESLDVPGAHQVVLQLPAADAVVGAALMALQSLDAPAGPDVLSRMTSR